MAALIPSASATGSGTMTLAGPSTNSNQTITIPDATGTMMVSGNMPAFAAYPNVNQSISAGTNTKVALQVEVFDTANAFDNTTNYRFTPQVAGYYQVNAAMYLAGTGIQYALAMIYKNGSKYNQGQFFYLAVGTSDTSACVSSIVYLNGSTDYLELYCSQSGGSSTSILGISTHTYFNACLIRGA